MEIIHINVRVLRVKQRLAVVQQNHILIYLAFG